LSGRTPPAALLLALLSLCGGERPPRGPSILRPDTLLTLPHDPGLYTQGLQVHDGLVYESSGGYGRSLLATVDPGTGAITATRSLHDGLFAEGLTFHGGYGYLLTWREGLVLRFDPASLEIIDTLRIAGEGWGICSDGRRILTSDGSAMLVARDPEGMSPLDTITVTLGGMPRPGLNELEWTEAGILANLYGTNRILRVSPATGDVLEVLDLSAISEWGLPGRDVMNGIAALEDGRLLVTGKLWHRYYVIPAPEDICR
jgi:glutamine cyclotransferase